jgi:hypothetical protein
MYSIEIEWDGVDWIDLAQDGDWWRAFVNMLMNFGFHKLLGKHLSSCTTGTSQEGLSSMTLFS